MKLIYKNFNDINIKTKIYIIFFYLIYYKYGY